MRPPVQLVRLLIILGAIVTGAHSAAADPIVITSGSIVVHDYVDLGDPDPCCAEASVTLAGAGFSFVGNYTGFNVLRGFPLPCECKPGDELEMGTLFSLPSGNLGGKLIRDGKTFNGVF